jgi:hypothetical protein
MPLRRKLQPRNTVCDIQPEQCSRRKNSRTGKFEICRNGIEEVLDSLRGSEVPKNPTLLGGENGHNALRIRRIHATSIRRRQSFSLCSYVAKDILCDILPRGELGSPRHYEHSLRAHEYACDSRVTSNQSCLRTSIYASFFSRSFLIVDPAFRRRRFSGTPSPDTKTGPWARLDSSAVSS